MLRSPVHARSPEYQTPCINETITHVQGPDTRLRGLCDFIRQQLGTRKLLVIIDDIWPKDFPLLENQWLDLVNLTGGSACVLTSRHFGLAVACGDYQDVPLQPMDNVSAQDVLLGHADANHGTLTEEIQARVTTCIMQLA